MAEIVGGAFLSPVFHVIYERITSRDLKLYFNKGLVEELEITVVNIQNVLDDAETKQYQYPNLKNWLDDLKHEVYEVDQLLDVIASDVQQKGKKMQRKGKKLRRIINQFESMIILLLKKINVLAEENDRLKFQANNEGGFTLRILPTASFMDDYDVIYGREHRFGLNELSSANYQIGVSWKLLRKFATVTLVDESVIYGREHEKEEIIDFLLAISDSDKDVPIISIVGLIGIGKTTLALLVYNDTRIEEQFELKVWVSLTESFDVVHLAQSILLSLHYSEGAYISDLNTLQHQLQHRLAGKKYLLVLDGVWKIDGNTWEQLLLIFKCGSSGSKMIVTTRDKEVASIMGSTRLLHLKQLEESYSWSVFVNHAFRGRNVFDFPNLESIINKIVDKCGGLPLALKTLGNLLGRKFSEHEWVKILETDLWCLTDTNDIVNPILRLSYLNLHSNLKRCFAYCSIFPKGYEFEKGELIKLWMAAGLLKCCGRDKSEEELGNEFFDHLVSISFFQQSVIFPLWAGKYYFVIHDVVIDLAKSVSGEFCLHLEGDDVQDILERTRHIWCCLDLKDGDRKLEHISKIEGLHSLMVEAQGYGDQRFKISINVQQKLFSRLKYLRMLSFSSCNLLELADEIINLKLLRYLDLSYTEIASLPNSICMLYNLQTLLLQDCFKLTKLPSDLYKLINLCYLNLEGTRIKKMPMKIGGLKNLHMLTDFVVGEQCN